MSESDQKNRLIVIVRRVGWVAGFILSFLTPQLTAPLETAQPYGFAGAICGLAGFGSMYVVSQHASTIVKWICTAVALIASLASAYFYRELLYSEPEFEILFGVDIWLFISFCVAYFTAFALISTVYFNGGSFVINQMFKQSAK